jgi:putative DNA primase/helicase
MREHGLLFDGPIVIDGQIHRYYVDGDRKGRRNGWAVIHAGAYPAGSFGCWKRGVKLTWSAKETRHYTFAEREEQRRQRQRLAVQRAAEQQAKHAAAAVVANEIHESSSLCTDHPYLARKKVKDFGVLRKGQWAVTNSNTGEVTLVSDNALLVPMRSSARSIDSLQAIFPNSDNILGRDKSFLAGGRTKGCYCAIGKIVDDILIICEGLATGLSLHECTGYAVAVAFSAANLVDVARVMRARRVDLRVVIAADDDRRPSTSEPIKNPGIYYATLASDSIGAVVATPKFSSLDGNPSDYNDLHQRQGPEVVKASINAALEQNQSTNLVPPTVPPSIEHRGENVDGPEKNGHFVIRGLDHQYYYFFLRGRCQLLRYTKADFSVAGFIQLADLNWWEDNFQASNGGFNTKAATNWVIRVAEKRGTFDPNSIRGRGAWIDNKRVVFHNGQNLLIDGFRTALDEITSRFVYEAAPQLVAVESTGLCDEEGKALLQLFARWNWESPSSPKVLAGWCFLAAICGVLKWRPHIWLTGDSGSGKSTLMEDIVRPLLGGAELFFQGSSTEAGVRQSLGRDARPVLFDEAESENERSAHQINNVITLVRQASSENGARIVRGTVAGNAQEFLIRSMFCFSSIRVPLTQRADTSRVATLALLPFETKGEQENAKTRLLISKFVTDSTIGARLVKRALDNIDAMLKNIDIFIEVIDGQLGRRRDATQYGTLFAGAWALTSTRVATQEEATEFVREFDDSQHQDDAVTHGGAAVLRTVTMARVRSAAGHEVAVAEFIAASAGRGLLDSGAEEADRELQRHGLRVVQWDGRWKLLVARAHSGVKKLAAGSSYETDPWRQLARLEGARTSKQGEPREKERFAGSSLRYVEIPMEQVLGDSWESDFVSIKPRPGSRTGEERFIAAHERALPRK